MAIHIMFSVVADNISQPLARRRK